MLNKTPEQLAKIARKARENQIVQQKKLFHPSIAVDIVSELLIPTRAGETRVLSYCSYPDSKPLPVFINMHGGGFIMGRAEDDDFWCRQIATSVPCLVVSIDYRLAPEHKFPVALEECYDVIRWLCEHADDLGVSPTRIAVGGQSAGANLAAGLCLLARDRREFAITHQVLNYPPLDMTIDPHSKSDKDKILTARMQLLFNACYFRSEADARNPLISPLLASDLSGLPPALLISAELDPLRPEAEDYTQRLNAAGVPATCKSFSGCMHAFTHYGSETVAKEAMNLICQQLTAAFTSPAMGR